MPLAVDFSGNMLQFRFIDIDINAIINLDSTDFLFIPGFNESDSIAHINLPVDLFSKLFLFNLRHDDLKNAVYTKMKYALDSTEWYNNTTSYISNSYTEPFSNINTSINVSLGNVSFTNAIVNASYQIIPGATFQNMKYDYIRFLLQEITGSLYMNGLFRNTDQLLQNVISMDSNFNSQIRYILSQCGTISIPMEHDSYYNNPCRILIESILANDNVIETDNVARRAILIEYFHDVVDACYNYNVATTYYIYGMHLYDTTPKYYYPIYVNLPANSSKTEVTFTDASFSGYTFYTDTLSSSNILPSGYTDYSTLHNNFYPFHFEYGDTLGIRLTYKPKNNIFLGKTIHDRSYEVYLDMGLELVTNVPYSSAGNEDMVAIVNGGVSPHTYQANGINNAFQYMFYNVVLPSVYDSPYNFYPTLGDIANISFQTYVVKKTDISFVIYDGITFDESEWFSLFEKIDEPLFYLYNQLYEIELPTPEEQAAFDASYNNPSHNWFVSIYCRPRANGLSNLDGVGFDRFNSEPIVNSFDSWNSFDLTNLEWDNTINSKCSWSTLLGLPVEYTVTPYGPIKTNSDQQLMIISIGTKDPLFNGQIRSVKVTFKDGRVIQMV